MSPSRIADLRAGISTTAAKKLGIWLLLSLILSGIFFRDFWTNLPLWLSPAWIVNYHVAQWGVLVLCLLFLVLKRKQVNLHARSNRSTSILFFILGAGLVAGAILIPPLQDLLILRVLLASLGVFSSIFGRGARIPAILVAVFGFSVMFPVLVKQFFEEGYTESVLAPLLALMRAMNYPMLRQGQTVSFTSTGGENISANIAIECAGPITMSIFIVLYVLMMLDSPQSPGKGAGLFWFGVAGTWFQSLIRLVILMVVGRNLGDNAMWTAHYWTIYVLFPLWYLVFAYIYFRELKSPHRSRIKELRYADEAEK